MADALGTTSTATIKAPVSHVRPGAAPSHAPIHAVLFDAFRVFDPRSVEAVAESELPGHGSALTALRRTRQFEYTWLRTTAQDYADFWQCAQDALRFARVPAYRAHCHAAGSTHGGVPNAAALA